MLPNKYGKIVIYSTIGVQKAWPSTTVYNAAKAGVVSFSRSLSVDVSSQGININCIAPGLGLTDFGGGDPPEEILKDAMARTPNRKTHDSSGYC